MQMSWADCFKLLLFWVHSGENPVSPAIPKEGVGRVSGLENKRREATPGLPGKGPLGLSAAQRGPWASPPPPNPSSRNTWDHLCNASQHPAKPQTGLEPPARIPGRFGERCLRVQLLIIPALKRFIFMVLLVFIPDQVLKGHSLMWN